MSRLYSGNNRKLINKVLDWLVGSVALAAAPGYFSGEVKTEEDLELRCCALAKLSGLCLAMYQHFAGAVEALGMAHRPAVLAEGVKSYDAAMRRIKQLEDRCTAELN